MLAATQDKAEFLQAATGRHDVFEVVQDVAGALVVHPTRPGAQLIPDFARNPVDSVGEDEEIVRLAIVFSDPLYGMKIPPMTVTAAQLRERAEREAGRWFHLKQWLKTWMGGRFSATTVRQGLMYKAMRDEREEPERGSHAVD